MRGRKGTFLKGNDTPNPTDNIESSDPPKLAIGNKAKG